MTLFPGFLQYAENKTRVLVFSSNTSAADLLKSVLNFNGKDFDFFSGEGSTDFNDSDFVIFETEDSNEASDFNPNIVLVTEEIAAEKLQPVLENIVAGGVLIYPVEFSDVVESTSNYFRKLPFEKIQFETSGDNFIIKTEIGDIPLNSKNQQQLLNINGIKILAQQFGVMESEFYEAAMEF
ncbi:hypothetical protein MTP09_10140 [Chryseobacterium suipulveris]|uniref:Uncharacterized protein n=1 Tax=Chryseobacterium suipulveris TaxID=2929800 RepID=A0ABY4BUM6_9FLAO|nr:hypothetical protein [Chryseobacterium suipulveris]UOE40270.1 hypothetical protein MTP09_10140 [Chryseobacterium suipulveris]